MYTKQDWIKYFPFQTPRLDQEIAINDALTSLWPKNGQKAHRFWLANLPTGIGKSAIAITIARWLNDKMAEKTHLLTTQKILQEQYIKDFGSNYISNIFGRNQYVCNESKKEVSCEQSAEEKRLFGIKPCEKCPYTIARSEWVESEIGLANFAFFLSYSQTNNQSVNSLPRELIIVDEAHNLENILTSFSTVVINADYATSMGFSKDSFWNLSDTKLRSWIVEEYYPKLVSHSSNYHKQIKQLDPQKVNKQLIETLKALDEYITSLSTFVELWNVVEWHHAKIDNIGIITIKPLTAHGLAERFLFKYGKKIICMSGTLLEGNQFASQLGIPMTETKWLSMPSPFHKDNRKVFAIYDQSLNVSYKNYDENVDELCKKISNIINEIHPNESGIIHVGSYKLANDILTKVRSPRILLHDSNNRMEIYNKHITSSKNTILLSPSMTEGVDLKDDLSRFQIIAKLPYPSLGDAWIRSKMKRVKGWYEWHTIASLIQASGRSIRNENDWCITYILDPSFKSIYNRKIGLFPKWWKEGLEWI